MISTLRLSRTWLSVLGLLFALAAPASAQLATYNFNAGNGVATGVATDVAATNVAAGGGVATSFTTATYSSPILRTTTTAASTATQSQSLINDAYASVTLAPTSGNRLNFTNLTFQSARATGNPGTSRVYVYSSVDSFGDPISTSTLATQEPTLGSISVDLTAAAFQGLTTVTEFRFYVTTPTTGQSVDFDNIVFNGTVTPVPEPACLGLAGLAVAGWRLRRRLA